MTFSAPTGSALTRRFVGERGGHASDRIEAPASGDGVSLEWLVGARDRPQRPHGGDCKLSSFRHRIHSWIEARSNAQVFYCNSKYTTDNVSGRSTAVAPPDGGMQNEDALQQDSAGTRSRRRNVGVRTWNRIHGLRRCHQPFRLLGHCDYQRAKLTYDDLYNHAMSAHEWWFDQVAVPPLATLALDSRGDSQDLPRAISLTSEYRTT
jgi:hypothetical protein